MLNTNINIFHHPTTALFLDDDSDFFTNIYFKIAKHVRCKYYDNPNAALSMSQLPFKNFQSDFPSEFPSNTPVHDALFNSYKPLDERRFREPSVFVIDYAMPGINGLEVCEKVTNPYIKKILLTGVADEKIAIEALNEGLIDYYVHKQEENLIQRLALVIQKQQKKYFNDIIKNYPIYHEPSYIKDPAFSRYFLEICEQYNIVEYYFMDNPMGFLLVTKKGQALVLLAYTDEQVETHVDDCRNQNAPDALLTQLIARQNIPLFHDSPYYCYEKILHNWSSYLYPVTTVSGKDSYYCSLIQNLDTKALLTGYKDVILGTVNK